MREPKVFDYLNIVPRREEGDGAPRPPRDEREDMRAFLERDHEETDLIRLRLGRPALYTNEGAYCRWTPKAGAR